MRAILLSVFLMGCGVEQAGDWTFYAGEDPVMPAMDFEYRGLMVRRNGAEQGRIEQAIDLAASILGALPQDVDVSFEPNVRVSACNGNEPVLGVYCRPSSGRDSVWLDFKGQSLVHELLHVVDTRAGRPTRDHVGWDTNGYDAMDREFKARLTPVR